MWMDNMIFLIKYSFKVDRFAMLVLYLTTSVGIQGLAKVSFKNINLVRGNVEVVGSEELYHAVWVFDSGNRIYVV